MSTNNLNDADGHKPKGSGNNPRAAQSMRQLPVSTPPAPLRKSKSAPMRQAQNPVYYPQVPNQAYIGPVPPMPMQPGVVYPPYNPQYTAPYFPPMQQPPTVVIRQNPAPVPYQYYDPNFEAYFSPDVRPVHQQQSSLARQREQLQIFERTRPRPTEIYQPKPVGSAMIYDYMVDIFGGYLPLCDRLFICEQVLEVAADTSASDAQALEEAIQRSLTETSRRPSYANPSFGTDSDRESGYTSLAASSGSGGSFSLQQRRTRVEVS